MNFIQFVNSASLKIENRFRLVPASLLIGFSLFLASTLYVMPRFTLRYHGYWYAQLSQYPFNFSDGNPLRFRIFTPLIAYVLQLPHAAFMLLPWTFGVLLLALIYWWYREKEFLPCDALGMAALIAFSAPIFIPLISPGYTDTVSYFFLLLCFIFISNTKFLFIF